ncbi:Zwei Ig domain protein zig-8-like 24, partial [Homarus americanus]
SLHLTLQSLHLTLRSLHLTLQSLHLTLQSLHLTLQSLHLTLRSLHLTLQSLLLIPFSSVRPSVFQVSWIRRKDLHVLTTGAFTYTTDGRFRALHLVGSPYWTLQVDAPLVSDSGVYECQVSTQPKIFRRFTLSVVVPSAEIQGTHQMFMKAGSDINITCIVTGNVRGSPVTWYHTLPRHTTSVEVEEINAGGRGGVQLVTDKHAGTSWLLVTHATWRDAGNYTCAPANARPATVAIHVLDGKYLPDGVTYLTALPTRRSYLPDGVTCLTALPT